MSLRGLSLHLLSSCVAAAMLAGCGGSQPPIGAQAVATVTSAVPSHGYKLLYSFQGGSDGSGAVSSLTLFRGTLYGTTLYGGTNDDGTVFAVTPAGAEHVVYSFGPNPDGQNPIASLLASHGTLYGTTVGGGDNFGTAYAVTIRGPKR